MTLTARGKNIKVKVTFPKDTIPIRLLKGIWSVLCVYAHYGAKAKLACLSIDFIPSIGTERVVLLFGRLTLNQEI